MMIEIVVLTQPDCRFCEQAEAILTRVGRDHPLAIRRIGLDSPAGQALAARHGVLFAPGVLLDGQLVSYGRLSERRLRRHLERHPGRDRSGQPAEPASPRSADDASVDSSRADVGDLSAGGASTH